MKRSFFSGYVGGLCILCALSLTTPALAEQSAEPVSHQASEAVNIDEEAKKGALSLARGAKRADEPFYAGTSTWFLLSIALLGSIAVQRRTDAPD